MTDSAKSKIVQRPAGRSYRSLPNSGIDFRILPTSASSEFTSPDKTNLDYLLHAYQLHNPPRDVPILDVQIAVLVPVGTMCAAEDSFDPLILRNAKIATFGGVRVVAEHRDNRVRLVENHDAAVQVGDGDKVALNGSRGRHAQSGHDFADEFAFQIVVQQTALGFVITVADQQTIGLIARIQCHAVGCVELLEVVSFLAEMLQVFPRLVELEDRVAGISVGQENVPVRSNRDRGRADSLELQS
jgi:hypothetical protein